MANIRPNQLPPASSVNPNSAIIVDAGGPVQKATPIQVVDAAIPLATEEAAEAGVSNDGRMSPLRVAQAIDALGISRAALGEPDGAALSGYGTRNVSQRLEDSLSLGDFLNPTELADALSGAPTGDFSGVLQEALNTGRKVEIPDNMTIRLESPVTLNGQTLSGGGTIIKAAAALYGIILSGFGSSVVGMRFRPETVAGQPNSDIKLADGAGSITITGNSFYTTREDRIYSAIIAADDDSVVGGDFPYSENVKGVAITGNTFHGYSRPILLLCIENFTISSNIIQATAFDAIRVREALGWGIISDNQFIDIGDPASVDTQTRDAIDAAFCGNRLTISSNIVKGTRFAGFDIKGLPHYADGLMSQHIIINGNIIESTLYAGISIQESVDNAPDYICFFTVTNNHIIGCNINNISGGGTAGDAGILVGGSVRYANICGNHCVANYGRGIMVTKGSVADTYAQNITVTDNFCVNNTDAGIFINAILNGIISRNQCINDANNHATGPAIGMPIVPNQDAQLIGLVIVTDEDNQVESLIVTENILINNTTRQLGFSGNNRYSNNLAALRDNVEVGPDAYNASSNRARWAQRGRIFFGNGASPSASEGTFMQGDVILNVAPIAGGTIGIVCTDGGNPGTWKTFGTISA